MPSNLYQPNFTQNASSQMMRPLHRAYKDVMGMHRLILRPQL